MRTYDYYFLILDLVYITVECAYHMFCLLLVAPYSVSITGNSTYSHGEQLMLKCHSEGGPQLDYAWIFLGEEIVSTQNLTFDNVDASNGGNYTCNVTNSAEFKSHTIFVYSEFTLILYIASSHVQWMQYN